MYTILLILNLVAGNMLYAHHLFKEKKARRDQNMRDQARAREIKELDISIDKYINDKDEYDEIFAY